MLRNELEVETLRYDGTPNKRFPDGSAGGDCRGYKDNTIVCVVYNEYGSRPYETFMFSLFSHDHYFYSNFTNGKDAIELAENILHDIPGKYSVYDMDAIYCDWVR